MLRFDSFESMWRLLVLITPFFVTSIASASTAVNLQFFTYFQMKLPEQDVFVESVDSKTQVKRVASVEAEKPETLKKLTYSSTEPIKHDPFRLGASPLGPFSKGRPLGFTLDQWLSASGSGTYMVDGDQASISLDFSRLVANGSYNILCSHITFPPNVSLTEPPCQTVGGTKNSFKADKDGNGTIFMRLPKLLEASTKDTVTAIELAYHSDGKPQQDKAGDFGLNTHVQLIFFLPSSEVAAATGTQRSSSGLTAGQTAGVIALLLLTLLLVNWLFKSGKTFFRP